LTNTALHCFQLSSSLKEKDQNGREEQEAVEEEPVAGEDEGFDDTQATAGN